MDAGPVARIMPRVESRVEALARVLDRLDDEVARRLHLDQPLGAIVARGQSRRSVELVAALYAELAARVGRAAAGAELRLALLWFSLRWLSLNRRG